MRNMTAESEIEGLYDDPVASSTEQSHNLLGQRLGRKGRDTRDRILAALQRLLASEAAPPISLTAVAREASIGMTTLYLYFADLPELLLAALTPLDVEIAALGARFDRHWPDEALEQECHAFLLAHQLFWATHSRILHLRNSLADSGDHRMLEARRAMSHPMLACVRHQWVRDPADEDQRSWNYAVVLLTMLERMATITTDETFRAALSSEHGSRERFIEATLEAEARIIAMTIRDGRCRGFGEDRAAEAKA